MITRLSAGLYYLEGHHGHGPTTDTDQLLGVGGHPDGAPGGGGVVPTQRVGAMRNSRYGVSCRSTVGLPHTFLTQISITK